MNEYLMSVFISDIDTAKLYRQFLDQNNPKSKYQSKNDSQVLTYESLKTKVKSSWVILKVVAVPYIWEQSLTRAFHYKV